MPLIVRGLAHSDYMVGAFQGEDNLRTSLTKMVVVMVEVTSDLDCLCLGCLDHWQIGIATDRLLDSLPRHISWICCLGAPVVMICVGGDICGAGDICGGFFLFYSYYTWWLCRPCGSEENIVQQLSPDNFQEIIDYEVVIIWRQCPDPPRPTKMVKAAG